MLSCGTFLRDVCVNPDRLLSFSRLIGKCDGQGVPICVPDTMNNEWFNYDFLRVSDRTKLDTILAFVTVAGLWEIHWDVLDSQGWSPFHRKAGKLCRVFVV